jgi:hypothetical protein
MKELNYAQIKNPIMVNILAFMDEVVFVEPIQFCHCS